LAEVLVEVPVLEVRPAAHRADVAVGIATVGEDLEERGLPRAVRADDADALTAAHEELDALEQRAAAALGRQALRVEQDAARARRGREAEADALGHRPDVLRPLDAIELLQHLAAALRLLRLLPRDVLANEVLGLLDEGLLPLGERAFALEIVGARDG